MLHLVRGAKSRARSAQCGDAFSVTDGLSHLADVSLSETGTG